MATAHERYAPSIPRYKGGHDSGTDERCGENDEGPGCSCCRKCCAHL